jgi:hypothetical protein
MMADGASAEAPKTHQLTWPGRRGSEEKKREKWIVELVCRREGTPCTITPCHHVTMSPHINSTVCDSQFTYSQLIWSINDGVSAVEYE